MPLLLRVVFTGVMALAPAAARCDQFAAPQLRVPTADSTVDQLCDVLPGAAGGVACSRQINRATGKVTALPALLPGFCIPIDLYGGDPTGAAFSDTAWKSVTEKGSSCVAFGEGTYKFAEPLSRSVPSPGSFTVEGQGSGATKLLWPAKGGGLQLTITGTRSSFHVRRLSLLAGMPNAGNGLLARMTVPSVNPASQALSDVTDVFTGGSDGLGLTNYWSNGIEVDRASNINFVNPSCAGGTASDGGLLGVCVNLHGTATTIPVQFNFSGCSFYGFSHGIIYGDYVQGVTVSQCNFTRGTFGIQTPAGSHLLAQLAVSSSQFNVRAIGIDLETDAPPALIQGNMFLVNNNGFGITIAGGGLFSIIGNNFFPESGFKPQATTGIDLQRSTAPGVISGNTFSYMASMAVHLGKSTAGVKLGGNVYFKNGSNVINSGTGNNIAD